MANQIVLDVVIDTDEAARDVRQFTRTTEREMKKVGRNAAPAIKKVETTTKDLGKSLRGTEPAISAVSQSLTLMGNKGASAVGGLGAAFSGLVAAGSGPLALAVAGVTGLIAVIADLSDTSGEAADGGLSSLEDALERGRDRAEKYRLELVKLTDRINAAVSGISVDVVGRSREIAGAQVEGRAIRDALDLIRAIPASQRALASAQANATADEAFGMPGGSGSTAAADAQRTLDRQRARLGGILARALPGTALSGMTVDDALDAEGRLLDRLGTLNKIVQRATAITTQEAAAVVAEESAKVLRGGASGMSAEQRRRLGYDLTTTRGTAPHVFGPHLQMMRQEMSDRTFVGHGGGGSPFMLPPGAAAVMAGINQSRVDAFNRMRTDPMSFDRFVGLSGGGGGPDGGSPELTALQRDAASRANSFASSMTTALDSAMRTQDWSGGAQAIAGSIVSAVNQAFISGLIEAPIKKAGAQVFESLGGAFSGGEA